MEIAIVKFFNKFGSGPIDKVTDILSRVRFLIIFWIILAIAFLLFDEKYGAKIFFGIIIANALHFLITEGLIKRLATKIWGKRLRPYQKYPEIKAIGREFKDSSFPSSHMATTVAMLLVICFFYPVLWAIAVLLIIFMAYARLHQGMHYPSDILAGIILGIGYGWVGIFIINNFVF